MNPNIHLIATIAYAQDYECRLELSQGTLVNERDYVSNLTKAIRDFWRYRGLPCFAYSQTLETHYESIFGCDAMIVIRQGNTARICLFEAKLIRFGKKWDSLQKKSGISHFSDQLQRQSKWIKQAAIWEFFIQAYRPGKEPPHFDSWGSTCILHKDTYEFDKTYRSSTSLWQEAELENLLKNKSLKQKNLMSMIQAACQQKRGNYLPISNGRVSLTGIDETEERISIPTTLETIDSLVDSFCYEKGISNFLFLQVDS